MARRAKHRPRSVARPVSRAVVRLRARCGRGAAEVDTSRKSKYSVKSDGMSLLTHPSMRNYADVEHKGTAEAEIHSW